MEEKKKNVRLRGDTVLPGGQYEQVQIHGKGAIHGDITCRSFTMNGYGVIDGTLRTGKTRLIGKIVFHHDLEGEQIRSRGITQVKKNLTCHEIYSKGKLEIGQNLSSNYVKCKGGFTIRGNCEADVFSSEGQITIGGLLNAEEIQITAHNDCRVKEVGGNKITIWKRKPSRISHIFDSLLSNLMHTGEDRFTTDLIEGDDIYIENTHALTVRGKKVKIGPGCHIRTVEYKESLDSDPQSSILDTKQI